MVTHILAGCAGIQVAMAAVSYDRGDLARMGWYAFAGALICLATALMAARHTDAR